VLGFDTEAYGPIDDNLSAGGLAWRINAYRGDWKVPAATYRGWLWRAYNLNAAEARRKQWIYEIRLALSWCPGDPAILDALSKRLDPRKILILSIRTIAKGCRKSARATSGRSMTKPSWKRLTASG